MENPNLYLQFDKSLYRLTTEKIDIPLDIDPSKIISGTSISTVSQSLGLVFSGKTGFSNDETGYILGNDSDVQKFYIGTPTNYFNFDGVNVIISGTLTATAGHIGGWNINSTSIYTGTEDHSGYTANIGDVTLYSNGTDASLHFKNIYIDTSGNLYATSVTVSGAVTTGAGSSIDGQYLTALSVTAAKIAAGTITANEIATNTLTVGTNVLIGTAQDSAGVTSIIGSTVTTSFVNALNVNADSVSASISITSPTIVGGIIKTADTVGIGNSGVIIDTDGLRGYDLLLGETFNLPTNGDAPTFSSGVISQTTFEINTNAVLRTSATVGDGSAGSAGILINNTGLYACEASQALADANVKILIDGSAVIKMNVKGGQTDFNTGTGYFLGLSGGDYKFSIGSAASNYMTWDGTYLKIKGSFDAGIGGLINNSVYLVADLPVPSTTVGFNMPSAYEGYERRYAAP